MTACVRCRQKKRRCDQRRPTCRLCQLAGVECLEYDATTRRQISRSYVPSLERRIAYLESKLLENGIHEIQGELEPSSTQSTHSTPSDPGVASLPSPELGNESTQRTNSTLSPGARAVVDRVVGLARTEPGQELSFSQVLLTELMHATSPSQVERPQPLPQESSELEVPPGIADDLDTSAISLPTRATAQTLTEAYFRITRMNLPLLHEPAFQQKLDHVYSMPHIVQLKSNTSAKSSMAVFFVLEVFAIALLRMQKQDPSRVSMWLANRYHKTALRALAMASLPNNVEGVQALLLIALHSYYHPTFWAAWKTVGAALRLAAELGLHEDNADGLDPLSLDTRRRVFWVAYSMDRNLCAAMSMPSGLSDGAISAQFPSDAADESITSKGILSSDRPWSKCFALHMFEYRKIQSELRSMLWERLPPCVQVDLGEWQHQMRKRMDTWYNSIPPSSNLDSFEKGVVETLEVTYNTAVFHLYRPSLNNPSPSGQQAVAMAQAAVSMIHLYQRFFRRHMLSIYWRSIENIFSAGTALMLAYIQFPEVRTVISSRSLESFIHTCSSLLWGMVERFPSFQGKRDAFDIAAAKVLEGFDTDSLGAAGSVDSTGPSYSSTNSLNNRAFLAQNDLHSTFSLDGQTPTSQETEQQSWLQFFTPDDVTFHPDQDPFLFQDLDIVALLGNTTETSETFSTT